MISKYSRDPIVELSKIQNFSFEDGKEFSWKGCSSDKRYYGPFDEPALDKES